MVTFFNGLFSMAQRLLNHRDSGMTILQYQLSHLRVPWISFGLFDCDWAMQRNRDGKPRFERRAEIGMMGGGPGDARGSG
jgi:hypothetical protein